MKDLGNNDFFFADVHGAQIMYPYNNACKTNDILIGQVVTILHYTVQKLGVFTAYNSTFNRRSIK